MSAAPLSGRILNVDDYEGARYVRTKLLRQAGFEVEEAASGMQALDTLAAGGFDLALLDVNLPDIDGYEVCRRIKSDPRTAQVPVVMLSGKGGFFDKVKGRMVGATEYLTKPFETPAVLAVIANHCQVQGDARHG